jgi:hypothetical protein
MRRIILPSVAYQTVADFSTSSHKWHDFRKRVHPRTGREGAGGVWRYSCTLSLTSALDGVGR